MLRVQRLALIVKQEHTVVFLERGIALCAATVQYQRRLQCNVLSVLQANMLLDEATQCAGFAEKILISH